MKMLWHLYCVIEYIYIRSFEFDLSNSLNEWINKSQEESHKGYESGEVLDHLEAT